jgi:hypothetical protein
VEKRTAQSGLGSLATGAVTALAIAVQTGLAAVVGVIIARDVERGPVTDGFFAAYGVFVVLMLAAAALRLVFLPPLARARLDGRLGQETAAWAVALGVLVVPLLVVAILVAGPAATVLTGFGPEAARDAAEDVLPLMVLAAVAQLFAGLAASALAAVSYIVASVVGLAYIVARIDADGIDAVATGMALNGLLAVTLPTLALAGRARGEAMPRSGVRPSGPPLPHRLLEAGRSVSLPLALQAVYLVCLPFAAREGVGSVTSFGYAYLAASALVAVTSSSLGLVTSVPLARAGLDAPRVARHVVSSSWLALVAVGAAAGVFALAGPSLVTAVLGDGYGADVGDELGHLVALLAPWMVFAIAFSVTLPLLFVQARTHGLVLVSLGLVALNVPLAWAGQSLAGLTGLSLALAATTVVADAVMLHRLHAAAPTLAGLLRAAAGIAALGCVAFGLPALVLGTGAAACVGLVLYAGALALVRPAGLLGSWRYLRSLA